VINLDKKKSDKYMSLSYELIKLNKYDEPDIEDIQKFLEQSDVSTFFKLILDHFKS